MGKRTSAHSRGYDSRWQRASRLWLLNHPLCRFCTEAGRLTAATLVDHIIPHRGDQTLFWDETNWQSLCKPCHDGAKQTEEKKGFSAAIGPDGWPLDGQHPVNAKGKRNQGHGGVSKK